MLLLLRQLLKTGVRTEPAPPPTWRSTPIAFTPTSWNCSAAHWRSATSTPGRATAANSRFTR